MNQLITQKDWVLFSPLLSHYSIVCLLFHYACFLLHTQHFSVERASLFFQLEPHLFALCLVLLCCFFLSPIFLTTLNDYILPIVFRWVRETTLSQFLVFYKPRDFFGPPIGFFLAFSDGISSEPVKSVSALFRFSYFNSFFHHRPRWKHFMELLMRCVPCHLKTWMAFRCQIKYFWDV